MPILVFLRFFVVELWANTRQTDDVTLQDLTFDLWRHRACRWCESSDSIRIPSLKFVGLAIPQICLIFGHVDQRPGDLDLCLSTSKWGHPWYGLPANFQLAIPFYSRRLESGIGRTDGRTDRRRLAMHYAPTLWGGYDNLRENVIWHQFFLVTFKHGLISNQTWLYQR